MYGCRAKINLAQALYAREVMEGLLSRCGAEVKEVTTEQGSGAGRAEEREL